MFLSSLSFCGIVPQKTRKLLVSPFHGAVLRDIEKVWLTTSGGIAPQTKQYPLPVIVLKPNDGW